MSKRNLSTDFTIGDEVVFLDKVHYITHMRNCGSIYIWRPDRKNSYLVPRKRLYNVKKTGNKFYYSKALNLVPISTYFRYIQE